MGLTINGNSIMITEANIELVNVVNDDTGVAYIIITPEGGVGALPFMATGAPGMPALFTNVELEIVPYGQALPTPNPQVTLVNAGGPGLNSKYSLTFTLNEGAPGATGSPSISGSSDLGSSPALGEATEKFVLVYRASDGKWVPTAQKVGNRYWPASIAATAFNSTSPRLLSSLAIAAQPFDWYPRLFAQTVVTGSDGATPTRVDLVARLNDAASGDVVGFGKGLIGANAAGIPTQLLPMSPVGQDSATYGKVLAGNAATIHLRAEQMAASSSSWSTPAAPDTTFWLEVVPVL